MRTSRLLALWLWTVLALVMMVSPSMTADVKKQRQELDHWRLLAEQGDAGAQSVLGFMYYFGKGVPQDYAQAVLWYRRAAEQGRSESQVNLGYMYANGDGVPQDYPQAYFWYNLIATHSPIGAIREEAVRNRDRIAA